MSRFVETWTFEEIAILRQHFDKLNYEEIAILTPKHTKDAIRTKIRRLGFRNKSKTWAVSEIEILVKNKDLVVKEIEKLLNRSKSAIYKN